MIADRTIFMIPVFRGKRFENHEVPLDVLPDLAAYRDLVLELARHLFLAGSPSRKRVPKGFVDSFQLVLRKIEPGSACPVLERVPPSLPAAMRPLFARSRDVFDESRDLIDEVIAAAARRSPLPQKFPAALLPRFNQIGRGLRHDESIEFRAPGVTSGPRFDREVRKLLVLGEDSKYEDNVEVVGVLRGGHIDREVLHLRLDDGREVEVRCAPSLVGKHLVLRGKRVCIVGWGLYDRQEHLERVTRLDDISPLDEEDDTCPATSIDAQFEKLRALEPGWYEPETPAPSAAGLERVRLFLHKALDDSDLPRPYVYPTPEAGVSAEWSLSDWEVGATFDREGEHAELHATHLRSEAGTESSLALTDEASVTAFDQFLARFVPRTESAS